MEHGIDTFQSCQWMSFIHFCGYDKVDFLDSVLTSNFDHSQGQCLIPQVLISGVGLKAYNFDIFLSIKDTLVLCYKKKKQK